MDQLVSNPLLADKIQEFQDQLIPTIPKQTLKTLLDELQGLVALGIADTAINRGDSFPGFVLPNADNEAHSLSDFLSTGPLVISFYRGQW